MHCDKCGSTGNETKRIYVVPKNWFARFVLRGVVKVDICQTCISKLFRSCRADK